MNTEEFAEEIEYLPQGQSSKTINALIIRENIEPIAENTGKSLRNQAELYISYSDIADINKLGDRIKLSDMEGNSKTARINEILNKNHGLWHLRIGW